MDDHTDSVVLFSTVPRFDEVVRAIALEHGWTVEVIDRLALEDVASKSWLLVVIASDADATELVKLAAIAARNPQLCVIVIGNVRDPQVIADVIRAGADDYLTLPVDPAELSARMSGLITFAGSSSHEPAEQVVFDFDAHIVRAGSVSVQLSNREWMVLMALLDRDGAPVSVDEISRQVWGSPDHRAAAVSTVHRVRTRLTLAGITSVHVSTRRKSGYYSWFDRTGYSTGDEKAPGK